MTALKVAWLSWFVMVVALIGQWMLHGIAFDIAAGVWVISFIIFIVTLLSAIFTN